MYKTNDCFLLQFVAVVAVKFAERAVQNTPSKMQHIGATTTATTTSVQVIVAVGAIGRFNYLLVVGWLTAVALHLFDFFIA